MGSEEGGLSGAGRRAAGLEGGSAGETGEQARGEGRPGLQGHRGGPADFSPAPMTYDFARPRVSTAAAGCVHSACVWYYRCFYNNNCGLERDQN